MCTCMLACEWVRVCTVCVRLSVRACVCVSSSCMLVYFKKPLYHFTFPSETPSPEKELGLCTKGAFLILTNIKRQYVNISVLHPTVQRLLSRGFRLAFISISSEFLALTLLVPTCIWKGILYSKLFMGGSGINPPFSLLFAKLLWRVVQRYDFFPSSYSNASPQVLKNKKDTTYVRNNLRRWTVLQVWRINNLRLRSPHWYAQ